MARGPVGTPATPARGTHHGIVVAVHHQRPPSSQVDVLLPPVAHLQGAQGTEHRRAQREPHGLAGPLGCRTARKCECVCATRATAHVGAEAVNCASSAHPCSRRRI